MAHQRTIASLHPNDAEKMFIIYLIRSIIQRELLGLNRVVFKSESFLVAWPGQASLSCLIDERWMAQLTCRDPSFNRHTPQFVSTLKRNIETFDCIRKGTSLMMESRLDGLG